jgi:hypothetical protein
MNPDLLELYQEASVALAQGADPDAVEARILSLTEGRYTEGYAGLKEHATRRAETLMEAMEATLTPEERALSASGGRGEGALGDYATTASQAATLGFADELIGSMAPEMGERMSDRAKLVRENQSGWAQAAASAPAMLIPGGAAANAMRAGGLLRGAAVGMGVGAAGGAAMGIGEAQGDLGDRLSAAPVPAAAGAAAGAVLGPMGRLGQRGIEAAIGQPAERLARDLAREGGDAVPPVGFLGRARQGMVGTPRKEAIEAAHAVDQQYATRLQEVGDELFQVFDGVQPSAEVNQVISQVRSSPYGSLIRDRGVRGEEIPLTFERLRVLHNDLKRAGQGSSAEALSARALGRRLGEEMDINFPGYTGARRQYAMAAEEGEAYAMAYRGTRQEGQSRLGRMAKWDSPGGLKSALRTWEDNPAAQDAARRGLRQRAMDDLATNPEAAVSRISTLARASEEGRSMIREMFVPGGEGDRAFNAWMGSIKANASAQDVATQFRQMMRVGLTGAAFGAGAGAVSAFR